MRRLIIDTGALVALLDRSEKNHEICTDFLRSFSGSMITTEAVLTEALYLLNDSILFQKNCLQFILTGGIQLLPPSIKSLERVLFLMEKYHDTPMDYADATLVVLAEDAGLKEIFTLDQRGFRTYRIHQKESFVIYPVSRG